MILHTEHSLVVTTRTCSSWLSKENGSDLFCPLFVLIGAGVSGGDGDGDVIDSSEKYGVDSSLYSVSECCLMIKLATFAADIVLFG